MSSGLHKGRVPKSTSSEAVVAPRRRSVDVDVSPERSFHDEVGNFLLDSAEKRLSARKTRLYDEIIPCRSFLSASERHSVAQSFQSCRDWQGSEVRKVVTPP